VDQADVDLSRRSVALCADGTAAEFAGRLDDARRLFAEAWAAACDDYDRAVAAHYVAHLEHEPAAHLEWNQLALVHAERAERTDPALVAPLYGSLYVSLGHAYEVVGNRIEADRHYALAAHHGITHTTAPTRHA
jgi:hypothetical protein